MSNILNGRYENISDEMFRNIALKVGGASILPAGRLVETGAYQEITGVLADAQRWRNVTWVTGPVAARVPPPAVIFRNTGKVFYILCSEDMKKGDFVREIARTVGIRTEGCNIREVGALSLTTLSRWTLRSCI